jgi:Rrf2 family protein
VKLSSQEEYGLRCLLQVARRPAGQSIALNELSQLEGLSLANTAKILRLLRRKGFVQSTRGQAGGYALTRPAAEIGVGAVMTALGGRIYDERFCDQHSGVAAQCAHESDCSIRPVLRRLQDALDSVLGAMTLADLLCPESSVRLPHEGMRALRIAPAAPVSG